VVPPAHHDFTRRVQLMFPVHIDKEAQRSKEVLQTLRDFIQRQVVYKQFIIQATRRGFVYDSIYVRVFLQNHP
jgi:3-hydroxyacyl-CoA dehydrogenase